MSQKNQTVAEAVEQLFPTQTTSLVAPDPEDAKGVADWYQQVTAEVKAGKFASRTQSGSTRRMA
ncbi:hypothetical protein [[Acidovorax] ebreus]|uniref:hypothetical protein n=1 Tax=Diaphorobacter sp. LI3 TaxID=2952886 RepID=UPI002045FA5D|nr:hypothetical protein MRB47_06985 [Diaphorobacter sp. LI3]